ncbi:ABC-2 type transport system permease protein [Metabacillus crassostreae]|uniref:hypothetical protein n=1 Tax=Metabacillus crassostreae TaxID=929098 RepID=UPI00195ABF50|nr:hypothetical protein [Metabacillus crassostreae]MBM7604986.1 ABC-2 type transport system permease protein [Metabacillus crassostreae]
MKSKKSFFKPVVVKQDLKQHGWVSIVYFILLLFALPLEMLKLADMEYVIFSDYKNYFMINTEIQAFILFSIPIACGLLIFRYLQTEASVDTAHSLPIRRETLYVSHIISGLLLLLIPVLLTSCITFLVTTSIDEFNGILTISELISWTLLYILFTCFLFTLTSSVGMITGMTTVQAIFTYIFLFLPIGLVSVITFNLTFLLFGFSPAFTEEALVYLSPFHRFFDTYGDINTYSSLEIILYILFTILLFFIGLGFYKARQLEKATEVIAFPFLKPIFKYGVTFCSMALGGSYFSISATLNWNWIIFGYIVGALIGYTATEMILQKTWRIFKLKAYIGFVIYSVIFIIILFGIRSDLFHYENKLPKMDQISEVYFGDKWAMQEAERNDQQLFSDSKLYIQDVRNLHEHIIDERELIENTSYVENMNYMQGMIIYKLKNGSKISREYHIPIDPMKKILEPVMGTEDYKKTHPEYIQLNTKEDISRIRISPNVPGLNAITISNKEDIESFKKAIKADILSQTLDSMYYPNSGWGSIELTYNSSDASFNNEQIPSDFFTESINVDWKKSYSNISNWLEQHNYLEDLTVSEKDINKIELAKLPEAFQKDSELHTDGDMINSENLFRSDNNILTMTKNEHYLDVVQNLIDFPEGNSYYAKIILKNGETWYGFLEEEHIPEEIK